MESYPSRSRITACPPIFSGRESGTIESISNDRIGTVYAVRLDKYPSMLVQFRPQDLEPECPDGGAHMWVDGICERCFQEREVKK